MLSSLLGYSVLLKHIMQLWSEGSTLAAIVPPGLGETQQG